MSSIMDAALDPSCLMCVTPLGWHSPVQQGAVWPTGISTGTGYMEQLGLATLNNVTNHGQYFAATNPAILARVSTPIDIRGWSKVSILAEILLNTALGNGNAGIRFGQGDGYGSSVFRPAIATNNVLSFSGNFGGSPYQQIISTGIPPSTHARMTVGAVFNSGLLTFFMNGAVCWSGTTPAAVIGSLTGAENARVGLSTIPDTGLAAEVYHMALFNSALTAGKIARLSN